MPVTSAADVQSKKDFHLVFEDIGLMASVNDYQLATRGSILPVLKNNWFG
jgi:hypothetical protein